MGKRYDQLGLVERIEIYRLHADGKSLRQIAGVLGRCPSTISRELQRNSKPSHQWAGGYEPARADDLTRRRHARGRAHKLERLPALRAHVLGRLARGWSPEQIVGRLGWQHGRSPISHESIYRYIYWRSWSFCETLHRLLPRHKYRRGYRREVPRWSKSAIFHRRSIHDRPAAVALRARPGHWEVDLMSFSKQGQLLLVAHERKSRRTLLRRQDAKTSHAVARNLAALLRRLPQHSCRSITFDNGQEFSKHYVLRDNYGISTWFCDTHSPWQKGGIENAIGRLRRALPRKTDLAGLSNGCIAQAVRRYNSTPRKCLGFQTPNEVFFANTVALQT
jgi:IS30 family transposase